jgi:hypothetical protein
MSPVSCRTAVQPSCTRIIDSESVIHRHSNHFDARVAARLARAAPKQSHPAMLSV